MRARATVEGFTELARRTKLSGGCGRGLVESQALRVRSWVCSLGLKIEA